MIRGRNANLKYIRHRYRKLTGEEWAGIDYHLRKLIVAAETVTEVISEMKELAIPLLSEDPKHRPLGHISNTDLLAEIYRRPRLFGEEHAMERETFYRGIERAGADP